MIAQDMEIKRLRERNVLLQTKLEDVASVLEALGQAWRNDWSYFDGRILKGQLRAIIEEMQGSSVFNKNEMLEWLGIHACGQWEDSCLCSKD